MPTHSPEFVAFLCYAHSDDVQDGGRITALRQRLEGAVQMRTGHAFPIFQDRENLFIGEQWRTRINTSLDGTTLLVTVITPSFLKSENCRKEVTLFLERERSLGRDDLIIPIVYVETPALDDPQDRIAVELKRRRLISWDDLRFEDLDSNDVRRQIDVLARHVIAAVQRPQSETAYVAETLPAGDGPGFIELLAEAAEASPLFTDNITDLSALITETGTLTSEATAELQATKTSPRSAAARLIIVRRLTRRLERPVSEIEQITDAYLDHLTQISAGMNVLIELVPDQVKTEEDLEAAQGLLDSVTELAEIGGTSLDALEKLGQALTDNYRLSSTLRPVLRRMYNAISRIGPSRREFEAWRDGLGGAIAALD